ISPGIAGGQAWANGTIVKRLGAANSANTAATIRAWGASRLYKGALVELDNGTDKERLAVVSTAGDAITLSSNVVNVYREGNKLRVIEAEVAVRYAVDGDAPVDELFSNLRLVNDQSMDYIVNNVNARSQFIT